MYEYNVR